MRDSVLGRELVTRRNETNESVQFIFEEDEVNISNEVFLSQQTREAMIREKTATKKKEINSWLASWETQSPTEYLGISKNMTLINVMNMWLLGNKKENVPPFKFFSSPNVKHLKAGPNTLSKMKQVMLKIENIGKRKNLWNINLLWNGEKVTLLWSGIWKDLEVYLKTVSNSARGKSRRGQISWRTCYNNMQKKGCFKGNTRRRYAVNTVSI